MRSGRLALSRCSTHTRRRMSDFRGLGAASAAHDATLSGGQEGRETPESWECRECSTVNDGERWCCYECSASAPEPAEYDPSIDYEERDDA